MSVLGIDLGSQNSVLATGRNRGIDIITNESSSRSTPSYVGFGPKARLLGEPSFNALVSNLKNTVSNLSRLIGRSFNDPDVAIEQTFVPATLIDINGQVGIEASHQGERRKFTATQLVAMFLTKMKETAHKELKLPVSDVVISVPAWYTDSQRRALLDASEIGGLKALRLINEGTAVALGYGITKTDLPTAEENKPRRIAFVDIGYSNYTVTVVEFIKGQLTIKSSATDRHFGGRNFDKALIDHFQQEFKEKFKVDINENPKARVRVGAAVEKLKKILSANSSGPISIESLMNDVDVRGQLKREEFEELIKPLLERATQPLEKALADAKLKPEDIDEVQMVGGCTRVPSLKAAVQNFFGKPLSFTLNQDEAVARGAAFACAILSPAFRVRDFSIHDIVNYPIEFTWESDPDIPDEDTSLAVFNQGNVMPSTKILTFYRKKPFDIEARYLKPDELPGKVMPWIGRFSVKGVKPEENDDFMICKLKARVNLHGILNVEQGYYVQEQEVEEPIPEAKDAEKKDGDAMDTDEKPKTRKVKKQVRKGDLPLSAGTASLDSTTKQELAEEELAMIAEDKLIADTEDKKNELESFIYELRGKIDETYAEFANEEEKDKVRAKCSETEDWLYEDGEDATKAVYVAKIDEVRAVAGPIIQRYLDKLEAERQERLQKEEEEAARKRALAEQAAAMRKAEEEARKKEKEAAEAKDTEMKDAGEGESVE